MVTEALDLQLGSIGNPSYETGWYRDPNTNEYYYYDATEKKWYVYSAGLLYPLAIAEISAPKTITIAAGDGVKITLSYKYAGPASSGVEEYFSIGWKDAFGYHPKVVGSNSRNLPVCGVPTSFTSEKTLTIPTNVGTNWIYLECKVWHGSPDVPETGLRYKDAFQVVGITAVVTEFTIVDFVKV